MPFPYNPLDIGGDQIRLLHLHPGRNSSFVTCSIEHHYLDDGPVYVALSYTWGNIDITKPMVISRHRAFVSSRDDPRLVQTIEVETQVEVTINLEAALRQLRASGYEKVWIDALCINQKDDTERREQVLKMNRIYKRAREVVVWLGPEGENSDRAMTFIRSHEDPNFVEDLDAQVPAERDQLAEALEALLSRPYWRRVWIVQEVVLARRIRIFCGPDETTMEAFKRAMSKHPVGQRMIKSGRVPSFEAFRNPSQEKEANPFPLTRLLYLSRASLATDRRDKIYGLLGLASDTKAIGLAPDYKATPETVFKDLTTSLLREYGRFEIFALRSLDRTPDDSLPSWVPDWGNLNIDRPWISEYLEAYTEEPAVVGLASRVNNNFMKAIFGLEGIIWKEQREKAARLKQKKATVQILKRSIKVQGIFIGKIDGISSRFERWPGVGDAFSGLKHSSQNDDHTAYDDHFWVAYAILNCLTMAGADLGPRITEVMAGDAMPPTMAIPLGRLHSKQSRLLTALYYPRVHEWFNQNLELQIAGRTLREWMTTPIKGPFERSQNHESFGSKIASLYVSTPLSVPDLHKIFKRINVVISLGMRLFVLDNGFVGMAHPHAQAGDVICKLQYCPVPFIMRPSQEAYRIIGEAWYLQASMAHGVNITKPWWWVQERDEELEEITIE